MKTTTQENRDLQYNIDFISSNMKINEKIDDCLLCWQHLIINNYWLLTTIGKNLH